MDLNEAIYILKKRQACDKDVLACSEHNTCDECPHYYERGDLTEAIDIVLKHLEEYKQAPC